MRLEWEEELMPEKYLPNDQVEWKVQHHLKKVWDKDPLEKKFGNPLRGQWKVSVAWVNKVSDHKYHLRFAKGDNDKTFRSLKAAKAYAVAIITLEGT
jgi:hypothetical protein